MIFTRKKKIINKNITDLLDHEDDFIIATHIQPDGDGIGATLAFSQLLSALKQTFTIAVGRNVIPPQYDFLPGVDDLPKEPKKEAHKVFVALDAANRNRLGDMAPVLDLCPNSINIDHHPDNTEFAAENWIESSTSSVSEQVYDLWKSMSVPLTKAAATCIYVGMLTDTGRWQYSNTTPNTLRIAAELVDLGVSPVDVFNKVYENYSFEWFKLLAVGMKKAVFDGNTGLVYTFIELKDLVETGAKMEETESLVDLLRSVGSVNVAMVIKETKPGEIKASLRSRKPVDVGKLARDFGGGGHMNAAGFVSTEPLDAIVEKVTRWLTAYS